MKCNYIGFSKENVKIGHIFYGEDKFLSIL